MAVPIIFLHMLQTVINVRMLSIGGQGVNSTYKIFIRLMS